MAKNKIFKLRPKAEQDLANIFHYSIQEFGDKRAEPYIKDLDASFSKLAQKPKLGKDYSFTKSNLLAYLSFHMLFFSKNLTGE